MLRLNREAYEEVVAKDIAWLTQWPRSLERDHIILTLQWSIEKLYGGEKAKSDSQSSP